MVGTSLTLLCPPYGYGLSGRHCERSEAIHLTAERKMDCFAALAMTEWVNSPRT